MVSSSRLRRGLPAMQAGTSIIAALVFAAILGAIALSLNALQSGSANTTALSAQAAAAAETTSDQTCVDGQDYDYTINAGGTTGAAVQVQTLQPCPSDASATSYITSQYAGKSLPITYAYPNDNSNAQTSYLDCNNGAKTTQLIPGRCLYTKQEDSTYKLAGWKCRVRVFDSSQSNPSQECRVQSVPSGGGASPASAGATAPAAPGTPGSPTVTPDTGKAQGPCPNGQSVNPTTGACPVYQGSCPNGQAVNATTGVCSSTPQGPCPNGQSVDSSGQCPSTTAPPTGACTVNGQSGTYVNGVCTPPAGGGGGGQAQACPAGMTCTSTGQNANNSNPLSSLLSGLVKGLGGSNCTPTAQNSSIGGNGTTLVPVQVLNPTTGTYTTTYVQQQQTGTTAAGQPCIPAQPQQQTSQQSPYGTGTNGAACPPPPIPPQCAAGATAQPVSATGNGCMTGYQCVPTPGSTISQTPTPQISCSPQVADVGQSVAIAYSCQNATGSTGGGFSSNNQTSGSATAIIAAPPSGTNTANYGITCTGSGQSASAQCSVQVNQPAIDLVADPQSVPAGQTSTIGWVTAGMKSCVVSSPDDAAFTAANTSNANVNGTAPTDAITADTHFTLTCTTLGGQTKTASTIVTVGAATSSASVNVSSTADAATVNHGDTVTITWNASSTPADSAIALWLIDLDTEQATALIAGAQSANGTYAWQLPAAGSTCDQTSLAPCASDLVDGSSYGIEAALYTPHSAYLGLTVPSGSVGPTYVDYGYTANPFTVGQ